MADANNPPVQGYKLEAPTRELALTSLSRFLGNDEAQQLWNRLCLRCKVSDKTTDLNELSEIFKVMSEEHGAIGVVGKSLSVRSISYRILSKTSNNHSNG